MLRKWGAVALLVIIGACSPRDKQRAREDLKKSGEAVKKELKNDAAFVKEQALKAREETKKGAQKLKKELNGNDKPADDKR